MPKLIPSSLPVILQTVETQLLNSSVVGDISNIYWIYPEEEPPPGITGQRDVLFAIHADKPVNVEGDGRFTAVKSGFDVYLRSTLASDRTGTKRDFMIAHRLLVNGVMNSLMGFFPETSGHDALTIEGLVIEENTAPAKNRDAATWGQTITTMVFHYLPIITQTP